MQILLPRTRPRRIALVVVVVALAVLLSAWLVRPEAPPSLATSPVERGQIEHAVEAIGVIKPSQLVNVGARVSGRIEKLYVALGDEVKEGDPIAQIDSRTQENSLHNAEAALRKAKANKAAQQASLKQYELTFQRQKTMLEADATSKAEYQSAKANLDNAKAQIRALDATIAQQETEVAIARTNLGYTKITAPMDGTVLAVVSKQGQTVNANQSAPTIVMLGNLDTMTVYAEISEADVVKTEVGQTVYFTVLGDPDKRYSSTLRKIAPAPESVINENNTSSSSSSTSSSAIYYNGLFDVANPDGELRTYMTAQVSIVLERAEDALIVPAAALGKKLPDGAFMVQVAGPQGRPEPRKVVVGLNNGTQAEIKQGLKLGEQVVVGQAAGGVVSSSSPGRRFGPPPMM